MGLWQALKGAVGGGLGDQWLEVLEADRMGQDILMTKGVKVRPGDPRNSNNSGTVDVISDGSAIHVYDNQTLLLVDSGQIVDMSAEPGLYVVKNDHMPSIMAPGGFKNLWPSVKNSFARFKYAGVTPYKQQAFFINMQEIKGIRFGTQQPIQYWDNFYNAELFLRCFGTYSLKIRDPILFYKEVVPRDEGRVDVDMINAQFNSEFMEALQAAINKMSVDGIRISQVTSKMPELSKYMSEILDESWLQLRGLEVISVGVQGLSYDDKSRELIDMRNQGAMLSDVNVRQGYVQGAIARGLEAAGSNEAGAGQTFMGMGIGMNAGNNVLGGFAQADQLTLQHQQQQAAAQQQAAQQAAGGWTCSCGQQNSGKFCSNCGKQRPEQAAAFCSNCGYKFEGNRPKFCPNCGQAQA